MLSDYLYVANKAVSQKCQFSPKLYGRPREKNWKVKKKRNKVCMLYYVLGMDRYAIT